MGSSCVLLFAAAAAPALLQGCSSAAALPASVAGVRPGRVPSSPVWLLDVRFKGLKLS